MNVDEALADVENNIKRHPEKYSPYYREVAITLAAEVERLRAELAEAKACIDAQKQSLYSLEEAAIESVAVVLAKEVERLRAMLVNLAIPVEALLLDEGSHKYIAPTVLAEIQAALKETRKQMRGEDERR